MFCTATRPRLPSTHLAALIAPRWPRLPERKNAHRGLVGLCRSASAPTRSQVSIASGENSRCCTKARRTPLLPQGNQNQDIPEVTVQANRTSYGQQLWQCTSDHFGLTALGAGLTGAGWPIPGTKPFVTPGSSRGTSLAGMAADQILGDVRLPMRLPTIVGGWGTGRALAIAYTSSGARFAGRAVPLLGEALLAYDAYSILSCSFGGGDDGS